MTSTDAKLEPCSEYLVLGIKAGHSLQGPKLLKDR